MPGNESDLSSLCRSCGFCCNGALFDNVPLAGEAQALTGRVRLRVVGERVSLAQPCSAWGQEGCGVYEQRPTTCRTFLCLLGRALMEGEVSLAEALATVTEAQAQAAGAEAALAAAPAAAPAEAAGSRSLWRRVQEAQQEGRGGKWAAAYVAFMKRVFLGRGG